MAVGLAPEAAVTFTLVRAWQVHALASDATDVLLRALVHICRTDRAQQMQRLIAHKEKKKYVEFARYYSPTHLSLPCCTMCL